MSEETMSGHEEDFPLGDKYLTCDCCDNDFDPEDERHEWHVNNDETTQCGECLEKVESY